MRITNEQNDIQSVLFSEEQIRGRVAELGAQLTAEYAGKNPLVVCILKGASFFYTDLCRMMKCHLFMDFIAVSSYGAGAQSSGVVRILKDLDKPINGKDVLIIEDIVDSGMTLSFLKENLLSRGAASLHIATLLDKPERRRVPLHVDYSGFTIPDEFVVGYGLDYAEKYRNLPDIGVLRPEIYE